MTEGGLNSVLVFQGSFFLKKKKNEKKFLKKKKKIQYTQTHTHVYTAPLSFSQNQSQTGFRIRRAWDHVVDVRPPGGSESAFEGTSWLFRMPTAASNRHCQIQGTLVASLEDGPFWIYIHTQNKQNISKNLLKAPTLTTLPG